MFVQGRVRVVDIEHAVLKGAIQGLTEFLPVSSTAHLIFIDALANRFGWHSTPPLPGEEEFFDIMLHLGTLVAVVFYFRHELWAMALGLFGKPIPAQDGAAAIDPWDPKRLFLYLVVSMAVTVVLILGVLKGSEVVMAAMGWARPGMSDLSEFYLQTPRFVALHLVGTGCLLFGVERLLAKRPAGSPVLFSMRNALMVGVSQAIAAIFHGFSRSGTTITGGVLSGLDRVSAGRYTFLLSIPTFLMAAVYECLKICKIGSLEHLDWGAMVLGMVVSAVVGYFCVAGFLRYLARHRLTVFSWYCWAVGSFMFFFFS